MTRYLIVLLLCLLPISATAQDKALTLSAPVELVDTGLLKHVLPRFSLKTGVRVTVTETGGEVRLSKSEGTPVIERGTAVWRLSSDDAPLPRRFADWLMSDVGKSAIEGFKPASGDPFLASAITEVKEAAQTVVGDTVAGEKLSLSLCGRCHVVNAKNRMNAIGSTPSFAVMRTFKTWIEKFETFYVLKPHGAFTQVSGVTPPFDPARPSPIAPVELTLDDLEAIIAYTSTIEPADLGQPVQSQ